MGGVAGGWGLVLARSNAAVATPEICSARWPYAHRRINTTWRHGSALAGVVAELLSAAEADSLTRAGGVAAVLTSDRGRARGVPGAAVPRVGAWQC